MKTTIKKRIEEINNGIVPEGYEKTSFGIFPCDWERDIKFGELFDFYGGLGKSREELGDQGVCYLHYGDMHTNTFNKVTYEQYSRLPRYDIALNGNETFLMQDGDIAFLDASEDLEGTSRAVLIDNVDNKPFIAGLHTILAKEKQSVFSKYYKQYITISQDVKKQFQKLAVGFKVYGLNRESIKKIKISYPKSDRKSDSEQSRIAEILMQWDKAIELQEKYIKQLEFRKKAIMQKLLTPKDEWDKKSLYNICKIETGKLDVNAMVEDGEYPFFTCSKQVYRIDQYAYECEALLMAGNGDIGDIKYYNGKFNAYQRTYVLYDFSCDIKYVMYFLQQNFDRAVMRGTQRSSMPFIKLELLKEAIIKIPKNKDFVIKILSQADIEISLQAQKLNKLLEQRKAMQQYLLTGIVRV